MYFLLFLSVRLHVRDTSQRIKRRGYRVAHLVDFITPVEIHRAVERVVTNNPTFRSVNHKIQRAHFATYTVDVLAYVVSVFVVDVCKYKTIILITKDYSLFFSKKSNITSFKSSHVSPNDSANDSLLTLSTISLTFFER